MYVRDPSKAASLFGKPNHLNFLQGDYNNLEENFRSIIGGHDRLFILMTGFPTMVVVKGTLAKLTYEAGVKQVVDISAVQELCLAWRTNSIVEYHNQSEEAIYDIPTVQTMSLYGHPHFSQTTFSSMSSLFDLLVLSTSSLPADSKRA